LPASVSADPAQRPQRDLGNAGQGCQAALAPAARSFNPVMVHRGKRVPVRVKKNVSQKKIEPGFVFPSKPESL
jgi:hypothetical protein